MDGDGFQRVGERAVPILVPRLKIDSELVFRHICRNRAYLNIPTNNQPTTRLLVRGIMLKLSPARFSSDEIP